MTPKLSLRSPAELISAVPYLLGFHPSDSVVVVGLRAKQLVFAARGDLDSPPGSVEYMTSVIMRQGVDSAAVIGFGAAERVHNPIIALSAALENHRVDVVEALRVADGRYWSYMCENQDCCSPDGMPYDPAASEIAAAATMAGQVALPDRAALVRQVAPIGGLTRESMRQATDRAAVRLADLLTTATPGDVLGSRALRRAGEAAVREAMQRHREGGRLTDDEVAWLTVLLVHLPVRDFAWERLGPGDWHVELWIDVLRRAEFELVPAPACLLAFAAWRSGQGALAHAAVERARRADPTYSMAQLLDEVLGRGVPPSIMDDFPLSRRSRPGARKPRRRPRRAKA
ncbi:DUF4192 domain-containing protein [Phytohabitans rumicis]|uniref:DUF4192 domain-containing protein n=1 Tax=Phytohabitans rumicis TaxID=1076125 RepID=A0A6V8L741_9ACTN|nr:DUF4192 domain-containing protein [Phytohabitans rumicis]GFJ90641.1 hypothetical protein Prum_042830 [Phytohabitans rumicis]